MECTRVKLCIASILNYLPLWSVKAKYSEVNFFKMHKKMDTIVDGDICKNHNSSLINI